MTIKELYEYALAHNAENAKINFEYTCNDDYYNYDCEIEKSNIKNINKREITILVDSF